MALSKEKKTAIISDFAKVLSDSKLVVVARYQGTSVKALQELRRQARDNGTEVRIIKNRLVKKAIEQDVRLSKADVSFLTGQLMYAASSEDEVAPAKVLADFAKNEPQIEFVAGFAGDGTILPAEDIKALAALPTKDQLRGQLTGLIASPLSGFSTVMSGNIRGLLNVLFAKAEQVN